jgi:hypothetical protein
MWTTVGMDGDGATSMRAWTMVTAMHAWAAATAMHARAWGRWRCYAEARRGAVEGMQAATAMLWRCAAWAMMVRGMVARGTATAVRFRRSLVCVLRLRLRRLDREWRRAGAARLLYTETFNPG